MSVKFKDIDIKSRRYYYFHDLIKISHNPDKIKID